MNRIYSAVRYRLDNLDRYLIYNGRDWQPETPSEDTQIDEVVIDASGKMPVFRSVESLMAYAQAHDIAPIDTDYVDFCNLDTVTKWMRRKRPAKLDCEVFLTAWNLLADISATVDGDFDLDMDRTGKIYDKLFWGTNPPAMTPAGRYYVPIWPKRESRIIREVMEEGLRMFRSLVSL